MSRKLLRKIAKQILHARMYFLLSKIYRVGKSLAKSALGMKGSHSKKPKPPEQQVAKTTQMLEIMFDGLKPNDLKKVANLEVLNGSFNDALDKFRYLLIVKEDEQIKIRIADCLTGLRQYAEAISALKSVNKDLVKNSKFIGRRIQHLENLIADENKTGKFKVTSSLQVDEFKLNLDSVQMNILKQLNSDGIALTSVEELLGSPYLWMRGVNEYERFTNLDNVNELIQKVKACKNFDEDEVFKSRHVPTKITYDQFFGTLSNGHPVGAILSHSKIMEIAWSYYGSPCKLKNPSMWVNPSLNPENQVTKKGSQQWHRDQEDSSILKCFIYFSDVTEATGATEYVKQSSRRFSNTSFDFHPFPFSCPQRTASD